MGVGPIRLSHSTFPFDVRVGWGPSRQPLKSNGKSHSTLAAPLQTGESSSLDLNEVRQRCDSIHCRSIYSEWIRSLSHSLSGGWVARPAKCDRLLLCSARGRRGEAPGSESPAGGLRCAVGFCDCTKRCPWRARLHHQSSSGTLVAQWSVPRATRPTPRRKKSAAVETKEETLTRLTQTGESSSLDLKEVGQRCDSIHWRSISSEWIRSLSHSLSGGWVARPA